MTRRSSRPFPDLWSDVFFFFSNRVGCLGSLLISLAVTAVLLLIFL